MYFYWLNPWRTPKETANKCDDSDNLASCTNETGFSTKDKEGFFFRLYARSFSNRWVKCKSSPASEQWKVKDSDGPNPQICITDVMQTRKIYKMEAEVFVISSSFQYIVRLGLASSLVNAISSYTFYILWYKFGIKETSALLYVLVLVYNAFYLPIFTN